MVKEFLDDAAAPVRRAALIRQSGELETVDGARIAYMIVGNGPRPLVFVPGAGDALPGAQQLSHRMVGWMEERARHFQILYISRRTPLTLDVSLEQQADDIARVMEHLGWPPSLIEAQSAGGPLGVLLAHRHPQHVAALALSSSAVWLDDSARALCSRWLELLRTDGWDRLLEEATSHFWSSELTAMLKPFQRLLARIASDRPTDRITAILTQLLATDLRPMLPSLTKPVLVTGGSDDSLFSEALQRQVAALLPQVTAVFQRGYGHGNDLQNPDHVRLLAAFARLQHIPAYSLDRCPARS